MNYALDITSKFEDEFADALNYIEFKLANRKAADSLEGKVYGIIAAVADSPYLYPVYHDDKIAAKGYRYAAVGRYLLFYRVDEGNNIIYIYPVLFTAGEISKVFYRKT